MAIFTVQERSVVGLTEEQCREQHLKEAPEGRLKGDLRGDLKDGPERALEKAPPTVVTCILTGHDVEEGFLKFLAHGTSLALTDRAVVNLANRRYFGGCPGQENFVGYVEIVARDLRFFDDITASAGHFDH